MRSVALFASIVFSAQSFAHTEPWPQVGEKNSPDSSQTIETKKPSNLNTPVVRKAKGNNDNPFLDEIKEQFVEGLRPNSNDRELVGSDGQNNSFFAQPGAADSLSFTGKSGTGPGGMPTVTVKSCPTEPGRLQFKYGHAPEPGCDKNPVQMSEEFADIMNNNFNRCAKLAAGSGPVKSSVKVWHAGVMGDSKHIKAGKSYHNIRNAIDINAIEVRGKIYDFKDPIDKPFFKRFRECWAKAADSARGGCLTDNGRGSPCATIGEEDSKHKNHLHISLPYCPEVAAARGMYIAVLDWILGDLAYADETVKPELGPKISFSTHKLKVKNGEVVITVKDSGGEPVGADQSIIGELTCRDGSTKKRSSELTGCSYDTVKYDPNTDVITIHYRTSELMKNGDLGCRVQQRAKFEAGCK